MATHDKPGERAPVVPRLLYTRRRLLASGATGASLAGAATLVATEERWRNVGAQDYGTPPAEHPGHSGSSGMLTMPGVVGEVDHAANGFDPTEILTDFDGGSVSQLPDGRALREYSISVVNKDIEVVPGTVFPAWTYNGRIPGQTIRVTEGDLVRVHFTNGGDHPHSMHFHGIHPGNMDGVFDPESGQIFPGEQFTYEFDAEPFGMHLYHCHTFPLAAHLSKGLYGAFIVDPKEGWPAMDHEFVMVMNGFDIDFDGENDFYAVNTIPFHYDLEKHPIRIKTGESVRIFLANLLEYDPINSFHLHANFFDYYPTGTRRTPAEYTDTIALMQAQRGILELTPYKYPGRYMFHAHKTEFAELGWTGVILVEE